MNSGKTDAMGLPALERQLEREISLLNMPARRWVPIRHADGVKVRDVVIIGAGMCGLAAAAQLRLLGIEDVVCIDRAPEGQEGPWVTTARMRTLRSPKNLAGPALGLPALTFRAWYEAQFGSVAWDALDKIPRPQWMEYLRWYRRVMAVPVENSTVMRHLEPRTDGLISLEVEREGVADRFIARHVVLATGRAGLGGPTVPAFVEELDRRLWAHTDDHIDFEGLAGQRVGVVGVGASAVDNAAVALESGAASVDIFVRRSDIPRVNKFTGIGSPGVVHGFAELPDVWKWRFLHYVMSEQTPPPSHSVRRVSAHANARFHLSSPVNVKCLNGSGLTVTTPHGDHELDFLILGTGFAIDLTRRPELSAIAPHICRWRDRFTPDPNLENEELADSPYLGAAFAFVEKIPGACPALAHIHCFNYPATLSHGKLSGDIPAVSDGAKRLAHGIAASLFVEDRQTHFADLVAYDTPELTGDEWVDASDFAGEPT